jgi:colanic acid biosynthesis protein WcaH
MKSTRLIKGLESLIDDPAKGLPEDVFLFISRITPIVNVDLLIKDRQGHTLLTWRDDGFHPAGWHIPGGIVRYKETLADRIRAVALNELGAKVNFRRGILAINEIMNPGKKSRGHFISLLYACKLTSALDKKLQYEEGKIKSGQWAWHRECPANLLAVHRIYRKFF